MSGRQIPNNIFSTKSINIVLNSWSSVSANLRLRGITNSNVLDYTHKTNSDRSKATSTFQLPEFPIDFGIFTETSLERGQTFIQAQTSIDGVVSGQLCSGYVSDLFTVPMGYQEDSLNGAGYVYIVTGTDVGAYTELSIEIPSNAVWNIKNVGVLLTQSTGSASREVSWIVENSSGNDVFKSSAGTGSSASSGNIPHYFSTYPTRGIIEPSGYSSPMGALGFRAGAGDKIITSTSNMHADDNYQAPYILVEEWLKA